jgi:hypothetical protein
LTRRVSRLDRRTPDLDRRLRPRPDRIPEAARIDPAVFARIPAAIPASSTTRPLS